jgi:hypothetical protein
VNQQLCFGPLSFLCLQVQVRAPLHEHEHEYEYEYEYEYEHEHECRQNASVSDIRQSSCTTSLYML